MNNKVLFLDSLSFNSTTQVGAQKYAKLFNKNDYEVFSLSRFLNIYTFIRKNYEDRELIQNWKRGVQRSKEGIYFYSPFCLVPYFNLPLFDNIGIAQNCLKYCFPDLKRILESYGFLEVDILFIHNIRLISVLKFIKPKLTVFRISDRIESFKNQPKTILAVQREVIQMSDVIFATSQNLQREASTISKKCFYLPNGVDNHFIMKQGEAYLHPEEYKDIKKPIVLYLGAISDWFDYELYEYGLRKLEKKSFVMIGSVSGVNYKKNLAKIQQYTKTYKNFYYLGPKPYCELKKYLAHADIAIIPFKINSLTNDINPVKLFEYAAYGLPIVAANMSELQNYKEFGFLYSNKDEYVLHICNSLDRKEYLIPKLISFARKNTWEKKFEYISSKLE